MKIEALLPPDPKWVMDAIDYHWGGEPLVSGSGIHNVTDLQGLGAYDKETPLGFLHYRIVDDALEVVTLSALEPGLGVGLALMTRAKEIACKEGCKRLWLFTTSDNPHAIAFYERMGMREVDRIPDYSTHVRTLKPEAKGTYDAVVFEINPQ